MIFTRTVQGAEAVDGTFGAATVTTIIGAGIFVRGDPQEYESAGLTRVVGPTVLFTPADYPLAAFTSEFVLPGDTTMVNDAMMTVTKVLSVVAPDGFVVVARIALGA